MEDNINPSELKLKIGFYNDLIEEAKRHNSLLNELLLEKSKKVMELNQKIEYLLQEQKYEILELLKSDEDIENIKQKIQEGNPKDCAAEDSQMKGNP